MNISLFNRIDGLNKSCILRVSIYCANFFICILISLLIQPIFFSFFDIYGYINISFTFIF